MSDINNQIDFIEASDKIRYCKVELYSSKIESGIHAGKTRTLYGSLHGWFLIELDGAGVNEKSYTGTKIPTWMTIPEDGWVKSQDNAIILYNALASDLNP